MSTFELAVSPCCRDRLLHSIGERRLCRACGSTYSMSEGVLDLRLDPSYDTLLEYGRVRSGPHHRCHVCECRTRTLRALARQLVSAFPGLRGSPRNRKRNRPTYARLGVEREICARPCFRSLTGIYGNPTVAYARARSTGSAVLSLRRKSTAIPGRDDESRSWALGLAPSGLVRGNARRSVSCTPARRRGDIWRPCARHVRIRLACRSPDHANGSVDSRTPSVGGATVGSS